MSKKIMCSLVLIVFCVIATMLSGCGESNDVQNPPSPAPTTDSLAGYEESNDVQGEEEIPGITTEGIYAQGNRQLGGYACFEGSRLYCPTWENGEKLFSVIQLNGLTVRDYKSCFEYDEGGNYYISIARLTPYKGDIYYSKMNWDTGEYGIYKMSQSGNDTEKILDAYGEFQIVDSSLYYTDWTEVDNFLENGGFKHLNDTDCHLYRCSLDGSNTEEIISDPIFNFYVFDDFILCQNDRGEANDDTEKICLYSLDGKKIRTLSDSHSYEPIYNGEYIYFLSTDERHSSYPEEYNVPYYLYRIDTKGNHLEKISDKIISEAYYILTSDSIYFANGDDNGRIYRMDLSGENPSLVVDREDCQIYGIFQGTEDFIVYSSDNESYINNLYGTNEIQLNSSF